MDEVRGIERDDAISAFAPGKGWMERIVNTAPIMPRWLASEIAVWESPSDRASTWISAFKPNVNSATVSLGTF